jgi:hypothetical protein
VDAALVGRVVAAVAAAVRMILGEVIVGHVIS